MRFRGGETKRSRLATFDHETTCPLDDGDRERDWELVLGSRFDGRQLDGSFPSDRTLDYFKGGAVRWSGDEGRARGRFIKLG